MIQRSVLFLLLFCVSCAFSAVKPAGVFTDAAVFQQGEPVRIWGTAEIGETVSVSFAGQVKTTVADDSGKWLLTLDPMPASSEPRTMNILSDSNTQILQYSGILVGEVWLAGGQSNMATPMSFYKSTVQKDIDCANDPYLRMVTIPEKAYPGHHDNQHPLWKPSVPQNVGGFSASAYYFAKNLRETSKVPVGIISCSVGGTPAEAWMSRKTLEDSPDFRRILDGYEVEYHKNFSNKEEYIEHLKQYFSGMKEWYRKQAANETPNPRPVRNMGPWDTKRPCGLYENMLTQTIPYTIKGVIWYQGENNAITKNGYHYRKVFPALIQQWREDFQNSNLPFLFVQLATYGPAADEAPDWPELREAQSWTEDHVDHTGMIVLVDGGEEKNIHPHSKELVGQRLSLLARHMVYGEADLVCRGPKLSRVKTRRDAVELTFDHAGSGLVLKSEVESAFEICGPDGLYVPAQADLDGQRIRVSSPAVSAPKHVRYGWKKWFVPTLFNAEGLPASPFRTDDFPSKTEGRYYLDQAQ
jgi:sialate O-acetylesterase